jgi:hypothetical protein
MSMADHSKAGGQKAGRQKLLALVHFVERLVGLPSKTLDFSNGTTSALSRTTTNQWREDMKKRTHAFAVDRFVQEIPDRSETRRLKDQLVGAASGADLKPSAV